MALPVAPSPTPRDVVVVDWAGITVRIAWTLLRLDVKITSEVLAEARTHVSYYLDPTTPPSKARDLAEQHTEAFVVRARGKIHADPWATDWAMPLSPRWRRGVEMTPEPHAALVFRKHYGDHRSLDALAEHVDSAQPETELKNARTALRDGIRRMALTDNLPIDDWSVPRIDRMLHRLAAWSRGPCPPTGDLLGQTHRAHLAGCPRCERLVRLVESGVLAAEDLFPPPVGARPAASITVMVLQIHPEGRRFRQGLREELDVPAYPAGTDFLMIDAAHKQAVTRVLRTATEVGSPPRALIRGILHEGLGTTCPRAILGPVPDQGMIEVGRQSWGCVEGIGDLPEELREPPPAGRAWGLVTVGALGVLTLLGLLLRANAPFEPGSLRADFTPARGGLWAAFDVPEEAWVTIVAQQGAGELQVVFTSDDAGDKVALAVGDGSYRLHVLGTGLLVAAHDGPLPDLDAVIADALADRGDHALDAVAASLGPEVHTAWSVR